MKWAGLIVAVIVAAVAAFLVLQFTKEAEPPPEPQGQVVQAAPEVTAVNVYVAANDIPIGTQLTEAMMDTQPWPQHLILDGFVTTPEDGQTLKGMVTRSNFFKGEPLIKSKLVNPEDPNFLAGALPKGMRIATVQTNEIDGLAGFVFPGDRVDVLVTHRIMRDGITEKEMREKGANSGDLLEDVTEVLVPNIRVMAVDQRATATTEDGQIPVPRSISLEVTPEDAQRLRLGEKTGTLSLALRSIEDKDTIETVTLSRPADLSQFQAEFSPGDQFIPVTVVRGVSVEDPEALADRRAQENAQRAAAAQTAAQPTQ